VGGGGLLSFIPVYVSTQPSSGRTESRENQQGKPEVIAILVQEASFRATDDRRYPPMYRQFSFLLRIGFCDVRCARYLLSN